MRSSSFINELPVEILSNVFLFCKQNENPGIRYIQLPLTLGLVCRRWRTATLIAHDLWSYVLIGGPDYPSKLVEPSIPALNDWLSRSGELPCTLRMTINPFETSLILHKVLTPITHRVCVLELAIPAHHLRGSLEIFARGLLRLHTLALALTDAKKRLASASVLSDVTIPFLASTNLQSIELDPSVCKFLLDHRQLVASLPPRLTNLVVSDVGLQTALDILSKCRDLESLELEGSSARLPDFLAPTPSNTSSSLRRLSVIHGNRIVSLFYSVSFPNLRVLHLTSWWALRDPLALSALASASPPLEEVLLDNVVVSSEIIVQFFEEVPTIKFLTLYGCRCFDEYFVSSLTLAKGESAWYLPRLQRLIVHEQGAGVGCRELVRLVASRWYVGVEGCSRIRGVGIENGGTVGREVREQILRMEEEGLRVNVNGAGSWGGRVNDAVDC
ncbi:hypothetical protein AX16_006270 [Volvariella volvacea WC 439]|nr:hypothetical protein AX16_006270 [Volvariella volvacea WC 439]